MDRKPENFLSPVAVLLFLGTAAVGTMLDLWTKALAVEHLADGHVVRFIPRWLHFSYTQNFGAVFGLGQGQRWLFIGASAVAIVFLCYLFVQSGKQRFYQFLLGMLMAGVLGNLYDRAAYGYVRDMINALPGIHWPDWIARWLPGHLANSSVFPWIFNVADSLLCVGVFLMIVYSFLYRAEKPELKPQMTKKDEG